MGIVAGAGVRSTAREGETGAGLNGVEITGAVVGEETADEMSPHALKVNVPAPNPINLMKSLRVILFFEVMFVLYLRKHCLHFSISDAMGAATTYTMSAFQPLYVFLILPNGRLNAMINTPTIRSLMPEANVDPPNTHGNTIMPSASAMLIKRAARVTSAKATMATVTTSAPSM